MRVVNPFIGPTDKPKIKLYQDHRTWFMQLEVEDQDNYYTIPRIGFWSMEITCEPLHLLVSSDSWETYAEGKITLPIKFIPDTNKAIVVEPKPRKMTLQEIEKKLGHPVEIISEKHG